MKPGMLNRRNFLRLGLLAAIASVAAYLQKITQPVGAWAYGRWLFRGYWQNIQPQAVVALAHCPTYQHDLLGALRQLWQQAEMPPVRGKRVLIKPNLVDTVDNHPSVTSPAVVGAAIDLLRELGAADITVGDGPAFRREALPVARACGLSAALAAREVRFVDLNYDDPQPMPADHGWLRRSDVLWLPRSVREADFILSLPKLKTHHWAGVSLSVKNLLGVVPGCRYGWPKNMLHINGFAPSIVGVYECLSPARVLALVDGVVGMEGAGPLFGTPVEHGLLAMGRDALAVDSVCARLMGFDPQQIGYLGTAGWAGLGQIERILTRGAAEESLQRRYHTTP
jgi:uncharacterized protein (DUF362 family)